VQLHLGEGGQHHPQPAEADLGVDAALVGDAGARTRVLDASPRPPRPDAEIVVDKGEGGRALAEFLIRNDLV